MTQRDRLSLKVVEPVASRFRRFQRDGETHTAALSRLMDEAGVPEAEVRVCVKCAETAETWVDYSSEGTTYCLDCWGDVSDD